VILVAVGDVESAPPAEVGVNLGSRLRRARQRSGLTLREVARQLGVSASFVSQLENGKSQPSVVTLYALTQLLGVTIDQMFEPEKGLGDEAGSAGRGDSVRGEGKRSTGQPARSRVSTVRTADDVRAADDGSMIRRADLASPADAWPQLDWGVIWEQLAPNTGHYLDFLEITYPPGSSSTNDNHMLRHMSFEFGYLLEGELEVTCGFEVFTVRAGGALGMDSSVPHLLRNRGSVPARGIWCVHHEHA
jgi:transcriptional regulator with XRE-family HTH domain